MYRNRLAALACALAIVGLLASLALAVPQETYKVSAPAGTTYHQLGEHLVEVATTANVTVYAVITGSVIIGAVEPTSDGITEVTITLIVSEEDEEILFEGSVKKYTPFEQVIPHETGHGEGSP